MLKIFKKPKDDKPLNTCQQTIAPESVAEENTSWFSRLRKGLTRSRQGFATSIVQLFSGSAKLDEETIEELETYLLSADVGIEATDNIINNLKTKAKENKISDGSQLLVLLKQEMHDLLIHCEQPLKLKEKTPYIILMVGINGAGKTTTIGKLAKKFQAEGKSVMLAAGDTFRAAAIEQLQEWGSRNNIPVVAQHNGADSASVIFDAVQSAKAKQFDVLIADTAGRLHTQQGLMAELAKVKRVIQKLDCDAPHEIMLVLDASIGQNALIQAKEFNDTVSVSGITMTKLDGTAKGGILFAIAQQLQIPLRFIGVGESIEDLQTFNAAAFIEAIFSQSD